MGVKAARFDGAFWRRQHYVFLNWKDPDAPCHSAEAIAHFHPPMAGSGAFDSLHALVLLRDRDDVLELSWHQPGGQAETRTGPEPRADQTDAGGSVGSIASRLRSRRRQAD